jgi:tetratricopeptide (TPR) repeat protein
MSAATLLEKIEAAVRARDIAEARKGIRLYLKKEGTHPAGRAVVAEWFRRLGLYREAYLVVAPKEWKLPRPRSDTGADAEMTETYVWTAYFLDLQGASPYALALLDRLAPETLSSLSIAATIQMSNSNFAAAIANFRTYFQRFVGVEGYPQKMLRISLADSLAGLGRFEEAFAELGRVHAEAGERFLSGILFQAAGEYHAKRGEYALALSEMDRALEYFPSAEGTVDSAFLDKWRGVALAGLGRKEEAAAAFAKALAVLDKPDHRPEMILAAYICMDRAGLLDPERASLIAAYPGLSAGFLAHPGLRPAAEWIGGASASIRIHPSRDEWSEDGKHRLGIPLEIKLLGHVRSADRIGISVERLKPLLWPEEMSAFLQLDARIAKLLQRLRTEYGIVMKIENGRIRADESVLATVAVETTYEPRPWTYGEANPEFEAGPFAEYYGLGRTIAFKRLADAVEAGSLTKRVDGRRVLYRIHL